MLSEDSAVVTFVRLVQRVDSDGRPTTGCHEETRIWQRILGRWKHVHFHRARRVPERIKNEIPRDTSPHRFYSRIG